MSYEKSHSPVATNRPVSFKLHIRPLFTADQRSCMAGYFDLDSFDEVAQNAATIYSRLEDKSMPLDETGPWPNEWIGLFRRWIDEGCPE